MHKGPLGNFLINLKSRVGRKENLVVEIQSIRIPAAAKVTGGSPSRVGRACLQFCASLIGQNVVRRSPRLLRHKPSPVAFRIALANTPPRRLSKAGGADGERYPLGELYPLRSAIYPVGAGCIERHVAALGPLQPLRT